MPSVGKILGLKYRKTDNDKLVLDAITLENGEILKIDYLTSSEGCWIFTAKDRSIVLKVFSVTSKLAASDAIAAVERERDILRAWDDFDSQVLYCDSGSIVNSRDIVGRDGTCAGLIFLTQPFVPGKQASAVLEKIFAKAQLAADENNHLQALVQLNNAFKVLHGMLTELNKFHNKTGLVHGDAWAKNVLIEEVTGEHDVNDYKIRLIDFDGSFKDGMTQEEYLASFNKGPGSNIYAAEVPTGSIDGMSRELGVELLEKSVMTTKADLHSVMASFVQDMLSFADLSSVKWFNTESYALHLMAGSDPSKIIVNEFIVWAVANVCNSPMFTREIANTSVISAALLQREKNLGALSYCFTKKDLFDILTLVMKLVTTNVPAYADYDDADKDRFESLTSEMFNALVEKFFQSKDVNRVDVMDVIKDTLTTKTKISASKIRIISRDFITASYGTFKNPASADARVSMQTATSQVEVVMTKINTAIVAVEHASRKRSALTDITNQTSPVFTRKRLKKHLSDELNKQLPIIVASKRQRKTDFNSKIHAIEERMKIQSKVNALIGADSYIPPSTHI